MAVIFCLQPQVRESLGISADGMLMSMTLLLTGTVSLSRCLMAPTCSLFSCHYLLLASIYCLVQSVPRFLPGVSFAVCFRVSCFSDLGVLEAACSCMVIFMTF